MTRKELTWKVFLLIFLNDVTHSIAQLLMKKGLLQPAAESLNLKTVLDFISGNAASPFIWLGIFVYLSSFFIWITILSKADLSVATPIASTDYVTIPLLAIFFLHEHVPPLRWFGIAVIVLGIFLVSRSKQLTALDRTASC